MKKLRLIVWFWFLDDVVKHQEATLMPRWLRVVYCIFFPIKAIRYISSTKDGYQWESDTWLIYGNRYSDTLFRHLAFGKVGSSFEIIERDDGVVTLKKI